MQQSWKKDYFRYKDFFLNIWNLYNAKPNVKIYLELILSLSTITIFIVFAIRPTILTIIELNNEIKSKESIIQKLDRKVQNLQKANQILQTQSEDISYIKQAVPDAANPEELIGQLEQLANQNSLKILGLSISDIVIKGSSQKNNKKDTSALAGNAEEVPFSISVTGEYIGIRDFLSEVESLRRAVKIDSMTINTSINNEQKSIVLILSGRTPFIKGETK